MSRLVATLRISSTWLVSSSAVIVGDTWGRTHGELRWAVAGWDPGTGCARRPRPTIPPRHGCPLGLTFRVTQQSGSFCSRYTSMMRSPACESCGRGVALVP